VVNHCRAVVRVDGTAIRKKIKKDYEKALRDLAVARQQLEQFQQTDQPGFTRWLNGHSGALLTEIRELSQKLAVEQELVFEVQDEVLFCGGSFARAYRQVMERRAQPAPPPPLGDEAEGQGDPPGAGPDSSDVADEEDPIRAFFEEMFGGPESDSGPEDTSGPWFGRRPKSGGPVPSPKRLKDLYRAVVRLLHPDRQREMTAQKIEWWHQAQAAYEEGDADQLEVILTLCEIGASGTTAHTSASLLQRITTQVKSSLRELKRQLSGHRQEPAWNFSQRTDHEALRNRLRTELLEEVNRMRHQLGAIQHLVRGWKAAAERLKPARRRRSQPGDWEFQF
jgi:hypothetical protein